MSLKINTFPTVLLFLLLTSSGFAQDVHLSASIQGLKATRATIYYYVGAVGKTDTVTVTNGKFEWTAKMPEPEKIVLMFPSQYKRFFVESGRIEITGTADLKTFIVKGSKTEDESEAYDRSVKDLNDQLDSLYAKWGNVSKEEQKTLEGKVEDVRMQKRARVNRYVADHPGSALSVSIVNDRAVQGEYGDINALYEQLDRSARQSAEGQRISARLKVLKRGTVGEKIFDFSQADSMGRKIQFAAFSGSYVLVDFWASWCGPCRAENPNVLAAYNQYKDKKFTVVGISLDENGARWKKAVRDDKLPWTQLSDLKGWKNALADYYGVQAIPFNFLVDPDGKIIAKNLRGNALQVKLAEVLN